MLLDFEFLAILNLLIGVLWPTSGLYTDPRGTRAMSIVLAILTIIVVVLDIVFLALRLIHG
jgi:hypothetical protein